MTMAALTGGPAKMAWQLVTNLGSAGLILPMLLLLAIGLWRSGQGRAMGIWLLCVVVAAILVLGSKIAFLGWGLGIACLDFTGASGHAALAAIVLPVWLASLMAGSGSRLNLVGIFIGLLVAALVSWSRVALGAHSLSESVAGWLVGAATSAIAFQVMNGRAHVSWPTKAAGIILILAFNETAANYMPTHNWETRVALALSGQARPHRREELKRKMAECLKPAEAVVLYYSKGSDTLRDNK